MKLPDFVQLKRDDFPESPGWWAKFLERINPMFEQLFSALRHLRVDDNFDGRYREIELANGVARELSTGFTVPARDVQLVWTEAFVPVSFCWRTQGNEKIVVLATWSGAPNSMRARLRILT